MQSNRAEKVEHLLKEEVANRSLSAAIAFALLAVITFFYHFSVTRFAPFVQAATVVMFGSSILRYFAARSLLRRPDSSAWNAIRFSVWVNALAWATITGLCSFELRNKGMHFAVLVTLMTGVLSGSLVTLSGFRSLYHPFMACCMIPAMAIGLYQFFFWQESAGIYLFAAYTVFTVYQYLQFRKVHQIQVDRIHTQLNLEDSLEELKKGQDAFVKQTAKLFHASKLSALGDMAGGLSHEVNNSLMKIMGSVDSLERYLIRDGLHRPEYAQKIQNSKEAIRQIKTVIEGLRNFSQQSEEVEKVHRPLEEIIQRTLNFCNEMIKANEITMIVAPIPEVMVHCNPMQITQILFYLTKNAFDALEEVSDPMKRWIRISFIEKETDIEIRVMNGGPQISTEVRSRLFQPFFTTKEVGKGTGLSLSISRGIALAHQGEIYLDDNTDCTTFALKIPAAPPVTAHA